MKPETFEAHGHTWTKHTPGDPMPCDKRAKVFILRRSDKESFQQCAAPADCWWWNKDSGPTPAAFEIIGWRYTTPPQERDELTCLREENASMQIALRKIHSLTDPYADGAPDASEHDKLALEISTITKPFT